MAAYPIVYDPEPAVERNRLTVFFRALLWLPHYVTLIIYGIGAFFAVLYAWFVLVFTGRYPEGAYRFVANVLRYMARQNAYLLLQVDRYPPFDLGEHPEYPVRVRIAPPKAEYSRMKALFRLILAIPVAIVNYAFTIVAEVCAIGVWVVGVITGRTPAGLHSALNLGLAYYARSMGYFLLLAEDWPPFTPGETEALTGGGSDAGSLTPPPAPPASTMPQTPPPGEAPSGFEPPRADPPGS